MIDATSAGRMPADARREVLLDAAARIVREEGVAAVTMASVANGAGVTRGLSYKHFANREEILASLYRREVENLDRALRERLEAAPQTFEGALRALVRALFDSLETRRELLVPLRPFRDEEEPQRRQEWDRRTVHHFTGLVAAEYGLDRAITRQAVVIVLAGSGALVMGSPSGLGRTRRQAIEDLCVRTSVAALTALTAEGGLS